MTYIVFDLEATCWEHRVPMDAMEIIEIGAVRLGPDLFPRDDFASFVRPALTMEGRKIFVFGGGYSLDRYRWIEGRSYWPEEMPSDAEYDTGRKSLQENQHRVDYILSHAGPYEAMRMFSRFSYKEAKLNEFLSWVKESTQHKHYYFGHLHMDAHLAPNLTVVYDKVYNLETGECLNPQERLPIVGGEVGDV